MNEDKCCETCRYHLGGGDCKINLEAECGQGRIRSVGVEGQVIYIGIDPGKKGGYAWIWDGKVTVHPWDDETFVQDMHMLSLCDDKPIAAVEKVGAMPGQGVTSMFSFGKSAGFIEGVLSALGIPYQLVAPQRWKTEFTLNHSKEDSVKVCKRLFPGVNLLPTGRCRKESDGMAEALLICEWGRRNLK